MTLTYLVSFSGMQAYTSNRKVKYVSFLFDLDLNPMTLILKPDLDMIKMYLYTKNDVPSFSSSKVIAWTDTQTDRQTDLTEIITYPQTRMVINRNDRKSWKKQIVQGLINKFSA